MTSDRWQRIEELYHSAREREGKNYMTIAIGCTGGRHRSVMVAERLAAALAEEGYETKVTHRDIGRAA